MTIQGMSSRSAAAGSWRALAVFAASLVLTGCDWLPVKQKSYATPEEAVQALIEAVRSGDERAMVEVLGKDAKPLIESGDPVQDANRRKEFIVRYETRNTLVSEGEGRSVLQVGGDEWPFPFPLVKGDAGWRFDTSDGVEEVVDRRIGRNELFAIQACLAYVDAQREYYPRNPEGEPLLHFAQHLISTDGKKDGLYWETAEGEEPSPLGAAFARARSAGYLAEGTPRPEPFYGYYYRVLTSQGPDAPGGAYDYVVRDKMLGGFALVAYPAERGSTGVLTFIVNHDGVVFSKDLGPDTEKLASEMAAFNPDNSWKREAAI